MKLYTWALCISIRTNISIIGNYVKMLFKESWFSFESEIKGREDNMYAPNIHNKVRLRVMYLPYYV